MTPVEPSLIEQRPRHPLEDRPACCEPQPFVEIDRLSLYYREKPAFQDVTLSINRGCITALVGPSGCGKTSFLTCLNRLTDLIAGCRVSGRITIDALDVLAPGTDVIQLRRRIGMIFQKPNPFPLTIRRNLEFPLREHGLRDREQIARMIETTLRDVGLWDEVRDRLDSPALALSGGQQQRLCIARALALSPEVLLMDEPCSALDVEGTRAIEELMFGLRGHYTIVIVTHNMAQARRASDECIFMLLGEMVEHGRTEDIFLNPKNPKTTEYIEGRYG